MFTTENFELVKVNGHDDVYEIHFDGNIAGKVLEYDDSVAVFIYNYFLEEEGYIPSIVNEFITVISGDLAKPARKANLYDLLLIGEEK